MATCYSFAFGIRACQVKTMKKFLVISLVLIIFALGIGAGYLVAPKQKQGEVLSEAAKDMYIAFALEVYDVIKENYWDTMSDEYLSSLFLEGTEKLTGQIQNTGKINRQNLQKALQTVLSQYELEGKKKEFVVTLADIVLSSLKPYERSRLYTTKQEKELAQNVKNINPETNQVEPTIESKLVRPDIFYLHIKKFSPTTFDELKKVTEEVDSKETLDTLILDLRGNIGGDLDGLSYFLGPFIGNNQYAYQFFHQGETTDFKTKTGWLQSMVRYKKVVILVDEQTQSSAEVFAAALKKYNVGVVVGQITKGWGTVERVFHLETKLDLEEEYSLFLAHSLTLREDSQPIEGNGVEPNVNINDPNWQEQLYTYFHYDELIEAVKEVL